MIYVDIKSRLIWKWSKPHNFLSKHANAESASQIDDLQTSLLPNTAKMKHPSPYLSLPQTGSYRGPHLRFFCLPSHGTPRNGRRNLGMRDEDTLLGETVGPLPRQLRKGRVYNISFLAKILVLPKSSYHGSLLSLTVLLNSYHDVLYTPSYSLTYSTCPAQHPRESGCKWIPSLSPTQLIVICRV
jgi:hypothetical protein